MLFFLYAMGDLGDRTPNKNGLESDSAMWADDFAAVGYVYVGF